MMKEKQKEILILKNNTKSLIKEAKPIIFNEFISNNKIISFEENKRKALKKIKNFFLKKEYDQMLPLLEEIYQENKDSFEVNYYFSLYYSYKKSFDSAIRFLHRILEISNKSNEVNIHDIKLIRVKFILSYIYLQKKEINKAYHLIDIYKNYNFDSKNIFYLNILGYLYYLKEDFNQAKIYYNKIIEIDNKNATAYNMLGYIYLKKEISKAIYFYKKAIEIDPNSACYLDSIGIAYYLNKDKLKAIEYLKKAYQKDPSNELIKRNLEKLIS